MLWFNNNGLTFKDRKKIFKYISCYGSTRQEHLSEAKLKTFKYISCYGST